MDFLQSAGLGIVAAVICLLLKQYRPEFALVAASPAGRASAFRGFSTFSDFFRYRGTRRADGCYAGILTACSQGVRYLLSGAACGGYPAAMRDKPPLRGKSSLPGVRRFSFFLFRFFWKSRRRQSACSKTYEKTDHFCAGVLVCRHRRLLAAPSEEEILSQSGADELYELLPEDTQNLLSEKGVESMDANALLDFSFGDLFTMIWEGVANAAGAPIKLFAAGAGLALLCALTAQVGGTLREDSFSGLFHAASVLCASAVIFPIVTDLFQTVSSVLQSAGGFITAFVPVYSAILAASGQPVGAALSETALLAAAQIVSAVSSSVLIPLLTVYLALCMVGAVCPDLCMDGITGAAKGIVTVAAGLLMTVFVGLLSLKGSLAGAADSVTLRTAKFAAGAVFPVVGGAVSDALSSVQGSMSLLRSSVGGFASIAIMAMLLPPFYPCF